MEDISSPSVPEGLPAIDVMVVNSEPQEATRLAGQATEVGCSVPTYWSATAALASIRGQRRRIVIVDDALSDMRVVEFIDAVRARDARCPILMTPSGNSIRDAVAAMRHGALDVVQLPVANSGLARSIKTAWTNES